MKKVLIICSNFLPVRNGGTIRCEKLAKYLPQYGWETIVLTKKPSKNQKLDFSLKLKYCKIYRTSRFDIATVFTIVRSYLQNFFRALSLPKKKSKITGTLNSNSETHVRRRIAEYLLVPDSDIFWAFGSIIKGLYILIKEKPQLIFSSGPSHSTHIIGLILKKISKKKWIIEFRDPWTMNPFNIPKPYKLLTIIDNYLEKVVLKNTDKINVTSEQYKVQFLEKYNFIKPEKIECIPNGFDPEDFENVITKKNEKFTIVHTGNFYQQRSSSVFIMAIISLFKENKLDCSNILVKFIGELDDLGKRIILSSEFSKNFLLTGSVPHKESLFEICNADVLLLIPGPGDGTMPGKFYEYLAASKPIFCIANEGPAKDIILKYGLGEVANDNNINEISIKINELINNIQNGFYNYPNVDIMKEQYNRKIISSNMSTLFNK